MADDGCEMELSSPVSITPTMGCDFLANDIANDAPLAHLAQKHSSRAHLESWSRKPPLMALKTEVDRTALLKFSFSQPSTPQPGSVRLFLPRLTASRLLLLKAGRRSIGGHTALIKAQATIMVVHGQLVSEGHVFATYRIH